MMRFSTGCVAAIGLAFVLGLTQQGQAWVKAPGLTLQATYQLKGMELTTEKIWTIDPSLKNPHLQLWALDRRAEVIGLKVDKKAEKVYGVTGDEVKSSASGYIRPDGPWYRKLSEFDCQGQPNSWFADQQGTIKAAAQAGEQWSQLLRENLPQLETLLSHVKADSESKALDQGEGVFRTWLAKVGESWLLKVDREVRRDEWQFYLNEARSNGLCQSRDGNAVSKPPSASSRMEPLSGENVPSVPSMLARAPVRLWNGLFSIRLNVSFAGRTLNGRFLIDSSAPVSQVSPEWLDSQGIYPAWIYVPGGSVEPVQRSRFWGGQRSLARRVRADRVEVSGLSVPLKEFLLTETDFFSPPETMGSCCDGVLGLDFLRLYPMEFKASIPPEVRIWPREGFRAGNDAKWIEVSELQIGQLVSECDLSSEKLPSKKISGVSWDFANRHPLEIHTPWRDLVSASSRPSLYCGDQKVAQQLIPQSSLITEKNPGMTIGMPLLSQSDFTLDLPHGRLWFPSKTLPWQPEKKNKSGLSLKYEMKGNERVLRVVELRPHAPSSALARAGLKAGMFVTQVDSKLIEEMDQWEVDRRLAGAYGPQVTLQWRVKKGFKVVPMQLQK